MLYGYARCSTDNSKQDIGMQVSKLRELGVVSDKVYLEFNKLLDKVIEGDTIVVTQVSTITDSTIQLCEIIELARSKKIKLVLGDFVVDFTKKATEGSLIGIPCINR
ncbi:recombinase family protein [Clostridium sp.]|uniref:recombinase family protein n=1 Tax=Clostridium sp. TaxID=1506 RepID=UPI00262FAB85|nr:recombinase family protein [uncultured Clostridium sp.]